MKNPAIEIADTLFPALCNAIVVNPNKLEHSITHGTASSSVSVKPDEAEAGSLIGRSGKTIHAFGLLATLIGDRHRWLVSYGVDSNGPNPKQKDRPEVIFNKEWNAAEMEGLLHSTLSSFLFHPADVKTLLQTSRRTSYEIVLASDEPIPLVSITGKDKQQLRGDAAVAHMLIVIFEAAGRLCSHTVNIAYVRRAAATELQPANANGRFVKEIASIVKRSLGGIVEPA